MSRICSRVVPRPQVSKTMRPCNRSSTSRSVDSRRSWTGSKKKLPASVELKRLWVDPADTELSVSRQCDLLGLSRSSYYYEPATEVPENLKLMELIDQEYTRHPFYGSRRMTTWLEGQG